jgi:ribosomal-protein-alanine N-acetyltransferase
MNDFHRITPHIRWAIRRDMAEIEAIENDRFAEPWSTDDFIGALRERNTIGHVAEWGERVIGFLIYELHRQKIEVLHFAVHREFSRRGVGTALVERLKQKHLTPQRRSQLCVDVPDWNLPAQLFMRAVGMACEEIVPRSHDDGDSYRFTYHKREVATA